MEVVKRRRKKGKGREETQEWKRKRRERGRAEGRRRAQPEGKGAAGEAQATGANTQGQAERRTRPPSLVARPPLRGHAPAVSPVLPPDFSPASLAVVSAAASLSPSSTSAAPLSSFPALSLVVFPHPSKFPPLSPHFSHLFLCHILLWLFLPPSTISSHSTILES